MFLTFHELQHLFEMIDKSFLDLQDRHRRLDKVRKVSPRLPS